jgi:peptidoglycan/LPS O-acetylase OafA/YrhL
MMNMLSGIMIAIAVLLLVASGRIEAAMKNVQVNSDIDRANKGIYTIGIIMLTAGVVMLVAGQKDLKVDPMVLVGLLGLLGLVLLVLAAIVISKGQSEAKSWGIAVLVGGIVFLVGSGAVIANEHKDKLKKIAGVGFDFGDEDDTSDESDISSEESETSDEELNFARY